MQGDTLLPQFVKKKIQFISHQIIRLKNCDINYSHTSNTREYVSVFRYSTIWCLFTVLSDLSDDVFDISFILVR